jgi:glucokinase
MLEFPILLADIGGTNARFAVLPAPGEALIRLAPALTASASDPLPVIRTAVDGAPGQRPRSAFLAVAARVDGTVVDLMNAGWVLDAGRVGAALGLSPVALVNDYVPVAAACAVLREGEGGGLERIGPALPARPGARLVLGPGTGFGAAALLPLGPRSAMLSSEAGHVELGPSTADELALWPHIEPVAGRVTAEAVLSGPGLHRLYRAVCRSRDATARCDTPSAVVDAALTGGDEAAAAALRLFVRLLGRFAGDLALTFAATGGVFIAGGIAPTIIGILAEGEFRRAFERKAPHEAVMRRTPTFVIRHPDPALEGLAAIASAPERFIFDVRSWTR